MKKGDVYPSKLYSSTNVFFVTADAVVLTLHDGELKVLLIKRKEYPYEGHWALPGGFVNGQDTKSYLADQEIKDACVRELQEETGVKDPYVEQLYTYTKKGRDPREKDADLPTRIFSVCHLCCVKCDEVSAVASDDAEAVLWTPMSKALKMDLAFDHNEALKEAFNRYSKNSKYYNSIMHDSFLDNLLIFVALLSFILGLCLF